MSQSQVRGPSMVTTAPFPLLNPWNWGALTPTAAWAATINLTRLNISAWRSGCDAALALWRSQQDTAMAALEETVTRAAEHREAAVETHAVAAPRQRRAA